MDLKTAFEISGWVIAGIITIVGMFNYQTRQRRKDDDSVSTNLISNLKTKTEIQEKELISLHEKEVEQGREIAHLQGQVKTLTEILQGKDPAMQLFLKQSPELLTIAKENNALAKQNLQAVNNLTTAITGLINKITPHLETAK